MKQNKPFNRDIAIDRICDRYENHFRKQNEFPDLDQFLDSEIVEIKAGPVDNDFRRDLATEIFRLRISLMEKASGAVDLAALRQEFPAYHHEIELAGSSIRMSDLATRTDQQVSRSSGSDGHKSDVSPGSGLPFFQRALKESEETRFKIGDSLGPFELLEHLGRGGMGTVWRARQSKPVKREVALKLMRTGRFDPQLLARFSAERQALATLEHPNIARIFDASQTDDGQPFLVMELVSGPPITEFADTKQLNLRQRIELFIPVCRAVQHAHQKGIIHRDLKPSNILVSGNTDMPVAKVIDFGLAKATETPLTDDSLHTLRGQVLGTPDYMSPEQTKLGQADVDTRSDVYSLGSVLYELLTGQKPFGDYRLKELEMDRALKIVCEVEPVRPSLRVLKQSSHASDGQKSPTDRSSWSKILQGELDWIVAGCLEKDLTRRYESAAALAADLERHLSGEPVQIAPPSRTYQLKKLVSKNRGIVAATASIFLALTAGLIATLAALNWAWAEQARAIKAAEDLQTSQTEVQKRANELEQVAAFQSKLIETIDPVLMGSTIRQGLLVEAKTDLLAKEREKGRAEKKQVGGSSSEAEIEEAGKKALEEAESIRSNDDKAKLDDSDFSPDSSGGIKVLSDDLASIDFTNLSVDTLKQVFFEPAIQRIDSQFKDLPEVRASLLDSLALAMADKGALELAESVQKKSLAIWEDAVGKDDIRYWRSFRGWATIDGKNSNSLAAAQKLSQVLENYRRLVGDGDTETVTVSSQLGSELQITGKTKEALKFHQSVFDWIENRPEAEPEFKLLASERLAISLDYAGRTTEAIKLAQNTLAAADKDNPGIQKHLISFYTGFATIMNESAKIGKPIEQTMEQLFGESSATLHGQAEINLNKALELANRIYGEEHPVTLEINNEIGLFKTFWLDWSYGVPFFEKALVVHERVLGKKHPQTLSVIQRLGESHFHLKQFDQAIARYQEAYDGFEKLLGPDHNTTLQIKSSIGVSLRDKGEVEKGFEILNDVYQRGLKDSSYLFFRKELAQTCVMLKKHDRAREIVQEQLRLSAERFEKGSFDYSTDLSFAWATLMYIEAWAEAEPILKETVDIMMKLKPDHHETYDRQSTYGECLVKLKRFEEAEPWLIRGHEGLTRLRNKLPARWEGKLSYATDRFIEFYSEQGNEELAEEWKKRLKEFEESLK